MRPGQREDEGRDLKHMFLGEHQHTLDAKGRVSLPAKFRAQMTGRLIVSKGLEGCLYVHPAESYETGIQRILAGNEYDETMRRLRRFFMSGASEVELDSAGRVILSPSLRAYAELDKDVAVIGGGERIEIWDKDKWEAYNSATAATLEANAASLAEKGVL